MNIKNRFMVAVLLAGLVATFHVDDCLAQSSGSSGDGSSGHGDGTGGGGSGGDGASSASDGSVGAAEGSGDSRGPLERVNRHAIKSMVLVRQLLAQSNVSLPAAK